MVTPLRRLGLTTLGTFAALAESDTADTDRFPQDAIAAHRLARGLLQRPPPRGALPPELTITEDCEHHLKRVDKAAFVAKILGETGVLDAAGEVQQGDWTSVIGVLRSRRGTPDPTDRHEQRH
ncbi:hypothetical protein [Amycolatopsis tolypomycina]|uniref:hypothetical protein n=1 Tax=Amycolatopsis tolypomycina TaxID=208445 RepID=UPI00115FDD27|nr:hypothetical protein [Amycolatopsis tolypomycina]